MTPSRRPRWPVLHHVGVFLTLLGASGADSELVWVPVAVTLAGLALVVLSYGGMGMGRCKTCKAPIAWVPTVHGRMMPVDAKPWFVVLEAAVVVPKEHRAAVVTDDGRVVWGVLVGQDESLREASEMARVVGGTIGRRPHWASCPQAVRFRRRRGVRDAG